MSGPEIIPFDWQRIWLGDAPPLFLLEIVFRTAVIFVWLLLLLQLTGKRGLAQLSALELVIVIALGSAAGDPLFYPEVPLLHAMLALALVVGFQRVLAGLVVRSERVETFMEGQPVELVRDGVFSVAALEQANLSREDLFEKLRSEGVMQLGEVRRAYFEQDGDLSVFRHDTDSPPGLPVVPPWDLEPPTVLNPDLPQQGFVACLNCGRVQQVSGLLGGCTCGGLEGWTAATTDPLAGAGMSADQS
ncbi:DUF421 domain-containing protein [Deinococcus humi]|uniref:Uncharacterized membrane protein YcaP (DUF421 family) n=1 Tax=Deinococcus humi TaxID=662880 RepID=A0A7W8JZ32_9DEIO|nr:YetF domain-containing protein [Deinococcus humi]MBB5364563.1 uncharacterized membrane protein YcaP (DUF421 family) [Deinococcus humi]GGO38190.1 DUF421 domain-containing protein [Deinococcus humi]